MKALTDAIALLDNLVESSKSASRIYCTVTGGLLYSFNEVVPLFVPVGLVTVTLKVNGLREWWSRFFLDSRKTRSVGRLGSLHIVGFPARDNNLDHNVPTISLRID
jgi:hypothetical protein